MATLSDSYPRAICSANLWAVCDCTYLTNHVACCAVNWTKRPEWRERRWCFELTTDPVSVNRQKDSGGDSHGQSGGVPGGITIRKVMEMEVQRC